MQVKMLRGEFKGRNLIFEDDEGQRLIDDGYAVASGTYKTREMTAEQPKKKRKRRTKAEMEAAAAEEAEQESAPDGD